MISDPEALQEAARQRYRAEAQRLQAAESQRHRAAVETRWRAEAERLRKAEDARLAVEKAAGAALVAKQQETALRRQASQWSWARRRDELQEAVSELRGLLAGASGRMENSPLEEATRAAGEKSVFAARLTVAERQLAQHVQAQPRFLA